MINVFKVRTAKRAFTASCGDQIEAGTKFAVEEPRPSFLCARCAKSRMETFLKDALDELTAAVKAVAGG